MIILENEFANGNYFAKITSIEEIKTKKGIMYKVTFSPSDEHGNVYSDVISWFEEKLNRNSIFCKLFDICGCTLKTNYNYSLDDLQDMFVEAEIGIFISVNEKDGRTFYNVTDMFEIAENDDNEDEEDDVDEDDDIEEDDESTEDEFDSISSVRRRDNIRYERGIDSRRRRNRGY